MIAFNRMILALALGLPAGGSLTAVQSAVNYDEAKVPAYELPDPLRLQSGRRVKSARAWREERRPELLKLFESNVYGRSPDRPKRMRFIVRSLDRAALRGQATRKEVGIQYADSAEGRGLELLIYLPNRAAGPVPAFLGLNFNGNHSIHPDPGITLSTRWMRANSENGVVDHRATDAARGSSSSRWPVEKILSRGYALVTAYYGDLEPDHPEGWRDGVRAIFGPNPGAAEYPSDAWGAIGAWAWGLSRAVDYLETDQDIDSRRVALLGHSRLGKTALWAGAQDERFALVISNDSGCGGAALSRRRFGETLSRITSAFPHWFCPRFKDFVDREDELPVDQHELIALMAPRPVYVASAAEDLWADPKGEFLSAQAASPVYEVFGYSGLEVETMPSVDQPVGDKIGYHVRTGKHDVTDYDWEQYLRFADRHWPRQSALP